ncbi:ROK family protein [Spirochaeta africana]|uniref:fructokinase n=1 Tax=Spirochaeta africana (strain ATCC 700263 / DSM 8902 / Z-7692) TaxID=889378 RepID=H9UJ51_SPIAZ|nr:ROK family protein [Spirochaeta africana]AFG37544.1 transcriptional regulator/sugar kinase [Spirochaeta africana DSM 8902]
MIAGIEAGGTKFVCAVALDPQTILEEIRFPTTTPEETIAKALNFFMEMQEVHGPITSLGVGSFGPIDPNPGSPTYGMITSTPKPHWENIDIIGVLKESMDIPMGFDTDVNGAALGEYLWGAGQGLDVVLYLTIGTGVGGGVVVHGKPVHGLTHPEMGHIAIPRGDDRDSFAGVCPYHGDCVEGLVSGPAIAARAGRPGQDIPAEDPGWDTVADYIAQALCTYICVLSPNRIIVGGGVLGQEHLLERVRSLVLKKLNGYIRHPFLTPEGISQYIVAPGLGTKSGVIGAFALGLRAARES